MAINVLVIYTCISILVNWYMYNEVQHYKSHFYTTTNNNHLKQI